MGGMRLLGGTGAVPVNASRASGTKPTMASATLVAQPQLQVPGGGNPGTRGLADAEWVRGERSNAPRGSASAASALQALTVGILSEVHDLEQIKSTIGPPTDVHEGIGLALPGSSSAAAAVAAAAAGPKRRARAPRELPHLTAPTAGTMSANLHSAVRTSSPSSLRRSTITARQRRLSSTHTGTRGVEDTRSGGGTRGVEGTDSRGSVRGQGYDRRESHAASPMAGDVAVLEKLWDLGPHPEATSAQGDSPTDSATGITAVNSTSGIGPDRSDASPPRAFPTDAEDMALMGGLTAALASALHHLAARPLGLPAHVGILTIIGRYGSSAGGAREVDGGESDRIITNLLPKLHALSKQRSRNHCAAGVGLSGRHQAAKAPPSQRSEPRVKSGMIRRLDTLMRDGSTKLLTAEEERALMEPVEDVRFLAQARSQLHQALGREPSLEEWALTVDTDISTLMSRLTSGRTARRAMVLANRALVVAAARHVDQQGAEDVADLVAAGLHGLHRALDSYQAQRGFRFATYAVWWIRRYIIKDMKKHRHLVRLPENFQAQQALLARLMATLHNRLGRLATEEELADAMELSVVKVKHLIYTMCNGVSSLDMCPGEDDEGGGMHEKLQDTRPDALQHFESESLERDVDRMLHLLNPREALVVRLRYGLDSPHGKVSTFPAIARLLKVTSQRANQIALEAVTKLRAAAKGAGTFQTEYLQRSTSGEWAARVSRGTRKS